MNNNEIFYAALLAFIIAILISPILILKLQKLKFGQYIRQEGPKSHFEKKGTPTMGGVIFIISTVIGSVFFAYHDIGYILAILCFISYGLIGFTDDYLKTVKKHSTGLKAGQKFILQAITATFFAVAVYYYIDPKVLLPFWNISVDMGFLIIPFIVLVIVAVTNAVNLTDGLDGLATGVSIIVYLAFMVIAYNGGQVEITVLLAAGASSCIAFLWYNCYPAQVFMGDTGSLALGALLASVSILTGCEILLIIIGGTFVIETLSVIIQVVYFKISKGKRVFKMAPLHHHFELSGWPETKVVLRMWIATMFFALVGIYIYFIV